MKVITDYDVAIIGGGLAGLSAAIRLRQMGHSIVVFEKEVYPFHKVCGEYVSLESWNFLTSLGLPLPAMQLPLINTLHLTAPNGKEFTTPLPLGGFGISRYLLDKSLADIAVSSGVVLLQKTKVEEVKRTGDLFQVVYDGHCVTAAVCCAAFGKRSNLDIKWNRPFLQETGLRLNNYIGIKYHLKTEWQEHRIGLHNFENGYCGISRIEDGKNCLCYMTKAHNLKVCGGSIERMEREILFQNQHLKKIFAQSEVLEHFPVTISQISFSKKAKVENGVLMLGDAAGMITPLCGNGMSIALHTAKIAADVTDNFLRGGLSRTEMETAYQKQWQAAFSARLRTGRLIQSFFGSRRLSNFFCEHIQDPSFFGNAPCPAHPWQTVLRHGLCTFNPIEFEVMAAKKTVVLGASDNPSRYSYLAINRLKAKEHPVVAVGRKQTAVNGITIHKEQVQEEGVDTITLYLNPQNQVPYYDYILGLKPKRIIFNPGTENPELIKMAKQAGIEPVMACTLVMLSTGQY